MKPVSWLLLWILCGSALMSSFWPTRLSAVDRDRIVKIASGDGSLAEMRAIVNKPHIEEDLQPARSVNLQFLEALLKASKLEGKFYEDPRFPYSGFDSFLSMAILLENFTALNKLVAHPMDPETLQYLIGKGLFLSISGAIQMVNYFLQSSYATPWWVGHTYIAALQAGREDYCSFLLSDTRIEPRRHVFYAAYQENLSVVKRLASEGNRIGDEDFVDLCSHYLGGESPTVKQLEILKYLIFYRVVSNPFEKDAYLLKESLRLGLNEFFDFVLEKACPLIQDEVACELNLLSVKKNDVDMLRLLIKHGLDRVVGMLEAIDTGKFGIFEQYWCHGTNEDLRHILTRTELVMYAYERGQNNVGNFLKTKGVPCDYEPPPPPPPPPEPPKASTGFRCIVQ